MISCPQFKGAIMRHEERYEGAVQICYVEEDIMLVALEVGTFNLGKIEKKGQIEVIFGAIIMTDGLISDAGSVIEIKPNETLSVITQTKSIILWVYE